MCPVIVVKKTVSVRRVRFDLNGNVKTLPVWGHNPRDGFCFHWEVFPIVKTILVRKY